MNRVFITGASSGLGEQFARVLSKAGAAVVLAARRIERLKSLRAELEAEGGDAHVVGLDVNDPGGDAKTFLRSFPVTYPSYVDQGAHTAFALKAGAYYPTTEFYDRTGKLAYTHLGPYLTLEQLESDAHTYAGA